MNNETQLQESRDWQTILAVGFAMVVVLSTARELRSWWLVAVAATGLVVQAWCAVRMVRSRQKRGLSWRGRGRERG